MLSVADVAVAPDFAVRTVTCRDDHRSWSPAEVREGHRLVLLQRGRFRRRVAGVAAELDRTVGYAGVPGEEEHFAHPAGGDVCSWVNLTPAFWRTLAGETAQLSRPTVYVDARLDLAHRRLLAAAGSGDVGYAATEHLLVLVAAAVRQVVPGPTPAADLCPADRTLAAAARAAISAAEPGCDGLVPLARSLGASPYRLSRAFRREVGVSLTRYRNRVRVGWALDRLAGGESSLAAVAADLGFADQAHLTRTVRAHLGHTPTALRRLLRG